MTVTVTRTYLELRSPADLRRGEGSAALVSARVERIDPVAPHDFRDLYEKVGRPFHWHDRDAWSDETIAERYEDGRVTLWLLTLGGERAGFYELEQHTDDSVEIVLFGLIPGFTGRGLGKWLLVDAAERAWSLGASRVWLHTCTLDSPAAMPNYVARGFRPFKVETYEVEKRH
jgi:GNAT superfamily N-acetyltransferase